MTTIFDTDLTGETRTGTPGAVEAQSGYLGVTGTLSSTLASFVSTASGSITVVGTMATTLDSFVMAAEGGPAIYSSWASVLDVFVPAISGFSGLQGTWSSTLDDFSSAVTGKVDITGTMDATMDEFAFNTPEYEAPRQYGRGGEHYRKRRRYGRVPTQRDLIRANHPTFVPAITVVPQPVKMDAKTNAAYMLLL